MYPAADGQWYKMKPQLRTDPPTFTWILIMHDEGGIWESFDSGNAVLIKATFGMPIATRRIQHSLI